MAGFHLLGVRVTELEYFGRSGLLAVWPLSDDRGRPEGGEIDSLDAARRHVCNSGRSVREGAHGGARGLDGQRHTHCHSPCLSSKVIVVAWRPMTCLAQACSKQANVL